MTNHLLRMQGICKRFGPTIALDQVSLNVNAGEVLALIGENGAGKSTLLKVLSGAHRADRGQISIEGKPYQPRGPLDARGAGVAMIYQELNLAPDLSVEDNILLGQAGTGKGLLFRKQQRQKIEEALEAVGLGSLSPTAIVGQQSIATQQLVEVARALISNAKIILFDEPTSSLPQKDVAQLFEIIDRLKKNNIGIVYISHFLEEVRTVADGYSVLRDGKSVGSGRMEDVSDSEIISLMVGRDVSELYPNIPHDLGDVRLKIKAMRGQHSPHPIDLSIRAGEIFGIAGLVGSGRTELVRTLFGLDHLSGGQIELDGTKIKGSVKARMRAGLGMLSEDRKHEGLAQELPIIENTTMGSLKRYLKFALLDLDQRDNSAIELMKEVEVKAHSGYQHVAELSGGNQQKVAIARILHQNAKVLIMDEPTKGIDVGTKAEIYRMMGKLAAQGKTILFISSYLPELLSVCDRIGVMARGRLREIREAADWTEDSIMSVATSSDR